jgi:hypothetical protein
MNYMRLPRYHFDVTRLWVVRSTSRMSHRLYISDLYRLLFLGKSLSHIFQKSWFIRLGHEQSLSLMETIEYICKVLNHIVLRSLKTMTSCWDHREINCLRFTSGRNATEQSLRRWGTWSLSREILSSLRNLSQKYIELSRNLRERFSNTAKLISSYV